MDVRRRSQTEKEPAVNRYFVIPTVSLFAASSGCISQVPKPRPNLLFIMTDQQRFDALGIAGRFPFLQTPNLDRLAAEGVWFTRAYTQCAVSAPVRASILTGLTVGNHRLFTNEHTREDPATFGFTANLSFDQILVRAGYYTEHHGKLHTPTHLADGYVNYVKRVRNGRTEWTGEQMKDYHDYIRSVYGKIPFGQGDQWDKTFAMPYTPDPIDRRYGMETNSEIAENELAYRPFTQPDAHGKLPINAEHSFTAWQSRNAIEALKRAKASGKPFSVTCSFHFPHSPMLATEPYYGMYPVADMPVPASISDKMEGSPYMAANSRLKAPEFADPEKIRYMMSNYFGLVTEIDHWVGELLRTLDKLGVADNTMVIFISDHGEMLGSHGMREKNVFFEESARVPMIIRFPGRIKSGTKVDGYVSTIDLYATILDYMGVENTQKTDSRSLRDLIENKPKDKLRGKYVVTEWLYRGPTEPNYMIVQDGIKLYIPYSATSKTPNVMHDLNADPGEVVNLLSPAHRTEKTIAAAGKLRSQLVEWLREYQPEFVEGVIARQL